MLMAKITFYVMFRFPLFVALCDHNPPTLYADGETDRRTDGRLRHASSINATCIYSMSR